MCSNFIELDKDLRPKIIESPLGIFFSNFKITIVYKTSTYFFKSTLILKFNNI